ncbi:MAG TPA: hypothetical protein VGF15_03840 [Solirubrobacteraceae bacterium]|jgi:hypothetical protein
MSADQQLKQRVEEETARRARLGVPAVVAGVLYLLSAIILNAILNSAPTVGPLQGLTPALNGQANPVRSPRWEEVVYESHHALQLIAGSVLTSIALGILTVCLLFVLGAVTHRRPETSPLARPLVLAGGSLIALLGVINEVVLSIRRHHFVSAHNYSIHAVNAITHNTGYDILAIFTPLAGLALVAGMIITMLGCVRVGLLPRWMGMVGGVSAVLLLLPTPTFDLIPSFWLVALGILMMGRWPKGDPPAWAAGEARPWPSQAQMRSEQLAAREAKGKKSPPAQGKPAQPSRAAESADVVPAPAQPTSSSSRRRRKRGGRR